MPSEWLEPLLKHLVTHFVSDKSRAEMVAAGINTVREICARVPLAMSTELLDDLVSYRKDREASVVAASRSLLQLYRDKMPELLAKKNRGRCARGCGRCPVASSFV